MLAFAVSVSSGFAYNLAFVIEGVTLPGDYLQKSIAMTLGDFFGCFVVMLIFHLGALLLKKRFTRPK